MDGIVLAPRPQFAGRAPFALQEGASLAGTLTGSALAVSGGTVLLPMRVPAMMDAAGIDLWCTDTSGAHTAEWALYRDLLSATLSLVPGMTGTFTFTPSAASLRSSAAAAVARLFPGLYWLAVRNTSAAVAFNVGSIAPTFARNAAQTKTIATALADTLDGVTGWTKVGRVYAVTIAGRVMGQATNY